VGVVVLCSSGVGVVVLCSSGVGGCCCIVSSGVLLLHWGGWVFCIVYSRVGVVALSSGEVAVVAIM